MPKEDEIQIRTGKIVEFIKYKIGIWALVVALGALAIRLFYLGVVKAQAVWWDEAEYLATSKLWAFGVPYILNPQRPPLFQALGALVFKSGLGEMFIKVVLVVIPSVLLVWAVYALGKELYNKKVGIFASIFTAVSWTLVFWSVRVQPDFFSMLFQVLAVVFMWRFWKTGNNKLAVYSGALVALGVYFKVSALLIPMSFALFMILKERLEMFKKKGNYLFALSFFATLIPYFIWSKLTFGTLTAFRYGYSNAFSEQTPFGWYNLGFLAKLTTPGLELSSLLGMFGQEPVKAFLSSVLFALFIIGVIVALRFVLYLDLLVKKKEEFFDANIFSLVVIVVVSAFYIFYIRATDDRWVFLWLPFMFLLAGNALVVIQKKLEKYGKTLAWIVVVLLVGMVVYSQMNHVNTLIELKKTSYLPVKLGSEWIKENSDKTDEVLTGSYTQTVYYTERNTTQIPDDKTPNALEKYLITNKPRFLIVSVFEPHPPWIYEWLDKNKERLSPVKVYPDESKKGALLIVYEIKY